MKREVKRLINHKNCIKCGQIFYRGRHRNSDSWSTALFCSRDCSDQRRGKEHPNYREKVTIKCKQCEKPFKVNLARLKTLSDALNCAELWDRKNGRTLCLPCHKETDTFGYKAQKLVNRFLNQYQYAG